MKFVYHIEKDNLKKVYDYMLKQSSIHSFFFFLCLFFLIQFFLFRHALWLGMIYYVIGSILFAIFLFIFTFLYRFIFYQWNQKRNKQVVKNMTVCIDTTHICVQTEHDKYCLMWEDIKKIKRKKEELIILPRKHQMVMLFEQNQFSQKKVFLEFCEKVKNYYKSMI